jgi:nucleoid DNA-binding protein
MAKKTSKAAAADGTKPLSKSEVMATLAEKTGLPKKDVATLFDELSDLIGKQLGKRGPGLFTVPGLMKLRVIRKPATKARKGINPFTKEETIFKAKPAKNVVKISPLKSLKDMV